MKKLFIIVVLAITLPLAGCHVSGSIGESSGNAESLTDIL